MTLVMPFQYFSIQLHYRCELITNKLPTIRQQTKLLIQSLGNRLYLIIRDPQVAFGLGIAIDF